MTTEKRSAIRVTKNLSAAPERVFEAWLDPAKARKFLFATRTGTMVRAEMDTRVGGSFVFVDRRDGQDIEHVGTYLEIARPRRLAFDFAVPKFSAEKTRVAIDIVPDGAGSQVTLTHEGVLPDYAERTKQGWETILDGLAVAIT